MLVVYIHFLIFKAEDWGCILSPVAYTGQKGQGGEKDSLIVQAFAGNLFIISSPIGKKQPLSSLCF